MVGKGRAGQEVGRDEGRRTCPRLQGQKGLDRLYPILAGNRWLA